MPSADLFFSYSHKDEVARDELEIHLSMLKRQGAIRTWHDRRIVAGDEFSGLISEHLESSDIILLLVSPYFLASEYCYDVEMTRALERHNAGSARVIPIILEPCDWKSAPFGGLLAMPQDGVPVSKFANVHDAFLQVTLAIRSATIAISREDGEPKPVNPESGFGCLVAEAPRSSNLRIRRTFSDRDKDRFREETFQYMSHFFENSLSELSDRNDTIETHFKKVDGSTFVASVYEGGSVRSECAISLSDSFGNDAIVYSTDKSSRGNSYNHIASIVDDGTSLGLTVSGNVGNRVPGQQSKHGAAEAFWAVLMKPLQR